MREFVLDDQATKDINSETDRQAGDVDRREPLVLLEIAQRYLDVVPEHGLPRDRSGGARVVGNDVAVEQVDGAVRVVGVRRRVRHHDDRRALLVKGAEQLHHFLAVY